MNMYLLFHTAAELFSVLIAWSIWVVASNARRYLQHGFFLLLGAADAAIGTLNEEINRLCRQRGEPARYEADAQQSIPATDARLSA